MLSITPTRNKLITSCLLAILLAIIPEGFLWAEAPAEHFESKIRPLFLARCMNCHGADKDKGGLRLDRVGLMKGGNSGKAVVPGKPEESLLLQALRQEGDLRMPPGGKLAESEIQAIATWIRQGAIWPESSTTPQRDTRDIAKSIEPSAPELRPALQAWYRAESIKAADGAPLHVWADASGHGRDLSATEGVRSGGIGKPASFVARSTINGRPAVRFGPDTGLASSPDIPVAIQGDAALTILMVMNLRPTEVSHPHDSVLGVGDPAKPGDPGKPMAALVQISRQQKPELKLAGGWNHDATLGEGSFSSLYKKPLLLTIIHKPGPLDSSTRFFIDGIPSEESPLGRKAGGTGGIPDIRHRDDIGLFMGKALGWCGSIRGDIGEVVVFNRALTETERTGVELSMAGRGGILHPVLLKQSRATFRPEEKNHWSFQPVKPVKLPTVSNETWIKTDVDRFILAKLDASGLKPAPAVDRKKLIRRLTFDLIGLPPTPEETDAFVNDPSEEALAKVVDRLLSSPHYGERWGRHWLDIVRYAETTANDANAVMRYAWRYRDYVIRSFNEDKPYNQFLQEQIAGDLLPATGNLNRDAEAVIGTGFLMLGPKALAETDKEQSRRDIIDDQIDTIGRAFLGLTIGCARCHDHKFDPIPTVDYYSLAGILRGTEVFLDENRNATMWQEWPLIQLPGEQPIVVMAPKEGKPTLLPVAIRGNYQSPGMVVPRRFLQILAGEGHQPLTTSQSGRLELARWVASADNPLTARVIVNRIWQHHFGSGLVGTSDNFGKRGDKPTHPELLDYLAYELIRKGWSIKHIHRLIVLSNTYQQSCITDAKSLSTDPSNRLLSHFNRRRLDAESLRDALLEVGGTLDHKTGGNDSGELLFKEAESIGAAIRPNRVQTDHPIYTESARRTIYLPVVRNAVPDVLALFDGADPNGVTSSRNETSVASQALFLLNHPFLRRQSDKLAGRVLDQKEASEKERIIRAYRLALGRNPTDGEIIKVEEFLQKYCENARQMGTPRPERLAWQSFCQTLLCRNEFLYVE